ncbi:MAG: hypothetical protein IT294_18235 [Deltaproteobacteria bacterium]|jgi:hypothetical protein|nr:hypothetical protein [Deltaproteobacteria bacterium]
MKGKRPDFIVNSVVELDGGQNRWREIGVAFWNERNDTLSVLLDAVPLSGKLVLMQPKQRSTEDADQAA